MNINPGLRQLPAPHPLNTTSQRQQSDRWCEKEAWERLKFDRGWAPFKAVACRPAGGVTACASGPDSTTGYSFRFNGSRDGFIVTQGAGLYHPVQP